MDESTRIEVKNLEEPWYKCPDMPDFPDRSYGGVAGWMPAPTESILVCGGKSMDDNVDSDKCFLLHGNGSVIQLDFRMLRKRRLAAGFMVSHNKMFITGGLNIDRVENTTEFVNVNDTTAGPQYGPYLPMSVDRHCFIRLNDTIGFLIGGRGNLNGTWFYDIDKEQWSTGPQLSIGRELHVCNWIVDSTNVSIVQMVVFASAGRLGLGPDNNYWLFTTELLTMAAFEGDHLWTSGPDIPIGLAMATTVVTLDRKMAIIVGGNTGEALSHFLYTFHCANLNCQWGLLSQELDIARQGPIAVLTDSTAFCQQEHVSNAGQNDEEPVGICPFNANITRETNGKKLDWLLVSISFMAC